MVFAGTKSGRTNVARSRNIKPGFFLNEYLGTCDPYETLLFEGLWCLADREGILENRPLKIKAQLFPYRENITTQVITGALRNLSSNKFLGLYSVNAVDYIVIFNFQKHQNPHKNEKVCDFPNPPENIAIKQKSGNYVSPLVIDGTARADSLLRIPDSLSKPQPIGEAVDNFSKGQTLVPENYQPDEDIKAQLFRAGRSDVDPYNPTLITLFITHHKGIGTTSDDWGAKFLNWCLREHRGKTYGENRTGGKQDGRSRAQKVSDTLDKIASEDDVGKVDGSAV